MSLTITLENSQGNANGAVYSSFDVKGMRACVLSSFSCARLFVNPWTGAHQAPLSMELSRQVYYSGLSCPPPGNLPDPGIEPVSPALQADSLLLSHWGSPCQMIASKTWIYAMLCYAKSLQSCPTLCHPIDSSPPGSPVPGILQARTLKWVAISFSNA